MDVSNTIGSFLPTGMVADFAGSTAPYGWLICDGSALSTATHPRLFEVIGYTHGGSGGTFNLPDCRGRVTGGVGTGSGLTARTLGAKVGTETHTLTESEIPSHTHIQNSHNHTQNAHGHNVYGSGYITTPDETQLNNGAKGLMGDQSGSSSYSYYTNGTLGSPFVQQSTATNNATTATNQNTGGGAAHNNMQPTIFFNKIIKY